ALLAERLQLVLGGGVELNPHDRTLESRSHVHLVEPPMSVEARVVRRQSTLAPPAVFPAGGVKTNPMFSNSPSRPDVTRPWISRFEASPRHPTIATGRERPDHTLASL